MIQVNQKLAQLPNFKQIAAPVRFSQFAEAIFQPIYDETGESEYHIEISKKTAYKVDGKERSAIITHSFENNLKKYDNIVKRIRLDNREHDVFFTVCPRNNAWEDMESGKVLRTGGENVSVATVCWLDIDYKLLSEDQGGADDKAVEILGRMDPYPNIIVKTPGGYHLYFLLDAVYPVDDVVRINRRLEKFTGADACGDAARMMRVPVGYHRKDPENPKKVEIIYFDDTHRYTLDNFDHYPVVDEPAPLHLSPIVLPVNVPSIDLNTLQASFLDPNLLAKIMAPSFDDYLLIVKNSRCKSRSERDYHIICQLIKSEIDDVTIKAIFMTSPCGDKYRGNGNYSDQYLAHQIGAAREAIHYEKPQKLTSVTLIKKPGTIFC